MHSHQQGKIAGVLPDRVKTGMESESVLNFHQSVCRAFQDWNKENIYTKEWNVDSEIPMSEDSLYLNVWTPAHTPDDRLPVFIWIHGGALQWGNTAEMEFDGERLARRGL